MTNSEPPIRQPTSLTQVNGRRRLKPDNFPIARKYRYFVMTPAEEANSFLNKRRQDLLDRLGAIESSRGRGTALSADRDPEFESNEVLQRLAEVTRKELTQVTHAIHRIETGHYAVCERCGAAIGSARLRVVPDATCCAGCGAKQAD